MVEKLKTATQLFNIENKVAVITGVLGAFGHVAARTLASAGCRLVIADDKQDAIDDLATELRAENTQVETVALWPNSTENCAAIVDCAVNAYGRLDILVVAGGTMEVDPVVDMEVERFEKVMSANVTDPWMLCQAAGRQMIKQGDGGKVVLVSSARGLLGHPSGYSAYCSSKHAVAGIVKSLGCEWGKEGISINALAPTVFRSKQTSWMFDEDARAVTTRESILSRIPKGRLGEPEDLAGPLMFLVSPASDFYTGHLLCADGGYTAG